jgi:Zn-dependent protease
MFLLEPNQTPYDLRWRMFGTHVRVHPLFWLVMVIFGWDWAANPGPGENGLMNLALWVLTCFVSILLHEFGHIWMGQAFGSYGHIVLFGFGGLAIGASNGLNRYQRIFVSAAGPIIQLLLLAFLMGLVMFKASPLPYRSLPKNAQVFLDMLLFVNLYWPLLNLLPIYPLDGGQICREVCGIMNPARGVLASLWISVFVAGLIAIHALLAQSGNAQDFRIPYLPRSTFAAIFFGLMAVENFQAIQSEKTRRSYWDDDSRWTR